MLTPLAAITRHRIILFAKQVDKWSRYYAQCPNITVQPVGAAFQLSLAKSSGLIASPSPGAVIQALGCAKPCYLFIPPGHLEQTCNYNYYMKHFIGVSSPSNEPIDVWADRALAPTDPASMMAQAYRVRDWLQLFDDAANRTLVRSLKRLKQQSSAGAEGWPSAVYVAPGAEGPHKSGMSMA